MTVLQLVIFLVRGMLAGRYRPGDLIARSYGPWDEDGRDVVKAIYFAGRRHLAEIPPSHPGSGMDHRMFGHHGTGPAVHVVALD